MFNCVFYPSTPQALSQLTLQSVVQVALVFSASHFSSPSLPRHDRRHDQHFTFYSFSIVAVDGKPQAVSKCRRCEGFTSHELRLEVISYNLYKPDGESSLPTY